MTKPPICLPCHLAKRSDDDGWHDCNGRMLILNEATTDFDDVMCACAGAHRAETTPDPKRGDS